MEQSNEDNYAHFTYIWAIENYPKLLTAFRIDSPKFTVDSMERTEWQLNVYALYSMDLFECSLYRLEDSGPESIEINFEFSILSADGKPVISEERMFVFKKDTCECISTFENIDNSSRRRNHFLPNDTATVRCRIWRTDKKVDQSALCFARTRLGTDYISLVWPMESFVSLEPYEYRFRTLKFAFKGFDLCMELALFFFRDGVTELMGMKIIKSKATKPFHMSWVISLVGANGETCISANGHKYLSNRENYKDLGKLFEADVLKGYKSNFFPFDSFCFKCEFEVEVGGLWSRIEYSSSGAVENTEIDYSNKVLACCCPLKLFVKQLYVDESLVDVNFRVDNRILHAHKSILGARSPVFKDVFTRDMNEVIHTIDVPDLDFEAFRLFLQYIYTDSRPHLEWQSALDLFKVSDKYKLLDFRNECFTFIKRNMSEDNFFDVVTLLHLHDEDRFHEEVKRFASGKDIEIAYSELWDALIQENPKEALRNMEFISVDKVYYFIQRLYNEFFTVR